MKKICLLLILTFLNFGVVSYATEYSSFDLSKTDTFLNLEKKLTTDLIVYSNLGKVETFSADFQFSSSNELVVTIDTNGKIAAQNVGTAIVTLNYKNVITKSIAIIVTDVEAGRKYFESFETDANATNAQSLYGSKSYDFTKPDYYCMNPLGHTAIMWFYDDLVTKAGSIAMTDVSPATFYYDVGVNYSVSATNYFFKDTLKNATVATTVARSVGWHQIFLDLTGLPKLYLDGVLIFSDTKTANSIYWMRTRKVSNAGDMMYGDGFQAFSMDGKPVVYDLKAIGTVAQGQTLTADYKFYHPRGHIEEGSIIEWFKSDTYEGLYQKVATSKDYTLKANEENAFFRFEVTPKTKTYTGNRVKSKIIAKKSPPVAKNVRITGSVDVGNVLEGKYDFFDVNGDNEKDSLYEWYIADTMDGEFTLISGENNISYTVKQADDGKFIKFAVTALAENEPYQGEKVFSAPMGKSVPPSAKNLKIQGEHKLGGTLTAQYEFYDLNLDLEGESVIKWWRERGKDDFEEIGAGRTYILTQNDIDKNIVFSVTPVSQKEPYTGTTVTSESFLALVTPIAKNVTISGKATVGQIIYGKYEYEHKLGVAEGESTYRWLLGGSVLGNQISLQITNAMVGGNIVFEVTPFASVEPMQGQSVQSGAIIVKDTSSSGSVNMGGGGYTRPVIKPLPTPITPLAESDSAADPKKFMDISGHWAEPEIIWAVENGYSKGMQVDSFMPDEKITKAQMLTILARAAKIEPVTYNKAFTDVSDGKWYAGYVQAMFDKKIIKNENKEFQPENNVTREEMAVMLMETYRYLTNEKIVVSAKQNIADRELMQAWNEVYVDKALETGLLKGMGNNAFKPLDYSTRAQAVTIIKRLLERAKQ